jgi:hypothetical protein
MKTIIAALVLAVVLFVAAAICWRQAATANQLADAYVRLATLSQGFTDAVQPGGTFPAEPRWQVRPWRDEERQHRTVATYWLGRYEDLTPWLEGTGSSNITDPAMLFAAANAAFRTSAYEAGDRKTGVQRLDGVVQAYANLLRLHPSHADAAYNYEYVSRLRDALARNKPRPRAPAVVADESSDLPVGPTIHGRPGAPPVGANMVDFKTITPMRFDEREENTAGRGKVQRRKG